MALPQLLPRLLALVAVPLLLALLPRSLALVAAPPQLLVLLQALYSPKSLRPFTRSPTRPPAGGIR